MSEPYVKSECSGGPALEAPPTPTPPAPGLSPPTGLSTRVGFVTAELSTILLDSVTDKDPLVQEQVCSALCALGESQPEETLSACEEHLRQHEKVWGPGHAWPLLGRCIEIGLWAGRVGSACSGGGACTVGTGP